MTVFPGSITPSLRDYEFLLAHFDTVHQPFLLLLAESPAELWLHLEEIPFLNLPSQLPQKVTPKKRCFHGVGLAHPTD